MGVGTTTPTNWTSAPLTLNSISGSGTYLSFMNAGTIKGAIGWNSNGTGGLAFLNAAGSGSANMLITDGGSVGIGTMSPGAKLEVAGQVKITGGTPGSGKVLTSDGSGLATWQAPSSSGSTPAGSASEVQFRSSASAFGANSNFVWDNTNGRLGIGTSTPQATLDVNGIVKLKINNTEPVNCNGTTQGTLALDANTNLCVCTNTGWKQANTNNSCQWTPNCPSNATSQVTGSYTCICSAITVPASMGYGSNPYTADSPICAMAVHAGVIPATGGTVSYTRLSSNPSSFASSTANQVTTSAWASPYSAYSFP